jgi:hypothetical protein
LKSEATRFKNKKISATIVADVKRFSHQIKRTRFSAHTGSRSLQTWTVAWLLVTSSSHERSFQVGKPGASDVFGRFPGRV